MTLIVYEHPLSPYAQKVKIAPDEKGTAYEAKMSVAIGSGLPDRTALESGLFKREYRDHRLEWMIRSGDLDVVLEGIQKDNIRFSNEMR